MTHTPTTCAFVECKFQGFQDAFEVEDPDQVSMVVTISFNGVTDVLSDRVTFARNALLAAKQTAVRQRVNAILAVREPGVSLTNANIQISGLPV